MIDDASFIVGPAVQRFERNFAEYLSSRHCVGLNNGTSALHMALLACDIGSGDEVITTPHAWVSTSWAISYVGARPVYVDIDPVTYTLDAKQVEGAITPRTKAIVPVHLYGQSADLDPLCRIARLHELVLIEDAAHAHGALYKGRRLGGIGTIGCFDFHPAKNLGAFGEAGAVVTSDDRVAQRVRCLRDHAQLSRHRHLEIGYNTRMEGIQGAVLDVKLRHLDDWNAARNRHAQYYLELLDGIPELVLPRTPRPAAHVWHLFVVLARDRDRDLLRKALAERGIGTGVHYPTPVPYQPAYAHLGHQPGDFPVAEMVMDHCISLPMFPELTREQVVRTASALRDCMELALV